MTKKRNEKMIKEYLRSPLEMKNLSSGPVMIRPDMQRNLWLVGSLLIS